MWISRACVKMSDAYTSATFLSPYGFECWPKLCRFSSFYPIFRFTHLTTDTTWYLFTLFKLELPKANEHPRIIPEKRGFSRVGGSIFVGRKEFRDASSINFCRKIITVKISKLSNNFRMEFKKCASQDNGFWCSRVLVGWMLRTNKIHWKLQFIYFAKLFA